MINFDLFVGIDWSGSKAFNTKSIAVAEAHKGNAPPKLLPYIRSRSAVADYIVHLAEKNRRVFIGIDANFGYQKEIGQKHFGQNYTYQDHWKIVDQYSSENENFYASGFWDHKKFKNNFWQYGKKPNWFDAEKLRRVTETQCIIDGYGYPESPFKICYTKQVGKGGLAAQRMAYYLKEKLKDKIAIWPFEHGDNASVVMTEIYPRQFLMRSGHGTTKVTDITDLNKALSYFHSKPMILVSDVSDHDTDALISAAGLRYLCGWDKTVPENLSNPVALNEKARSCEGWIFGVGDKVQCI